MSNLQKIKWGRISRLFVFDEQLENTKMLSFGRNSTRNYTGKHSEKELKVTFTKSVDESSGDEQDIFKTIRANFKKIL